jgi:hypothetical protein
LVPGYFNFNYNKNAVLPGLAFGDVHDDEHLVYDQELETVVTEKLDEYFATNSQNREMIKEKNQFLTSIVCSTNLVFAVCNNEAKKIERCQCSWMLSLFNERSLQSIDCPNPYKNK